MVAYELSICITVYNQSELLKWNLKSILGYKGKNVQVVVSDNCSTEDIKGLVDSFHDERIKYCRTINNRGQDGNIINVLRNCDSKYAFLLRTRDTILPNQICNIINAIHKNPNAAYWRFSALDENMKIRMIMKNEILMPPNDTILAHNKWLIHPSGEMYNLSYISEEQWDDLFNLVCENFPQNNGYVAHILIRSYLTQKSFFISDSNAVWIYADTLKASDKSVNSEKKRVSVYSPLYQYPRYKCEIDFIIHTSEGVQQRKLLKMAIKRYCYIITFAYKYLNRSKPFLEHYNCEKENYSRCKERMRFISASREIANSYNSDVKHYINARARLYTYFSFNLLRRYCHFLKEKLLRH